MLNACMTSLFAAALLVGCGSTPKPVEAPTTEEAATEEATGHHDHESPAVDPAAAVKAPGEADVGDTTTCPVSNKSFTVTAESPKTEHEGKTYYFCCEGCVERFQKNPAQYLSAGSEA